MSATSVLSDLRIRELHDYNDKGSKKIDTKTDRSLYFSCKGQFLCSMKEQQRDNAILEYIARQCKELRAKKGISQEIAYEDTGINIGKVETAKKNLTISSLTKLCRYYKVTLEEFFEGTNYPPKE